MTKKRPQNQKIIPTISGKMKCQRDHEWSVVDLNPERVTVPCPVCGAQTSIRQGFSK